MDQLQRTPGTCAAGQHARHARQPPAPPPEPLINDHCWRCRLTRAHKHTNTSVCARHLTNKYGLMMICFFFAPKYGPLRVSHIIQNSSFAPRLPPTTSRLCIFIASRRTRRPPDSPRPERHSRLCGVCRRRPGGAARRARRSASRGGPPVSAGRRTSRLQLVADVRV